LGILKTETMKEYEFKNSGTGDINIIYYVDGVEENTEYYSKEDGSKKVEIREGYTLKVK